MEAETDQIQRAEAALAAVDFNAVRPAQLLSGFPLAMDSFNHARRPVTGDHYHAAGSNSVTITVIGFMVSSSINTGESND